MNMRSEIEKGDLETRIFCEFVLEARLPIDTGSITKCLPPAPDILCIHAELGPLACELCEICAYELAEDMTRQLRHPTDDPPFVPTHDSTLKIARKKLAKTYPVSHPVWLLFHSSGRTVSPDDKVYLEIDAALRDVETQCEAVWLLGRTNKFYKFWPHKRSL